MAGVKQDFTTVTAILPACVEMGTLEQVMDAHQRIINKMARVWVPCQRVWMPIKVERIEEFREVKGEFEG